jgi:hypothetical protein
MTTDPSGKPYRFNEEQHEAVRAEFLLTNTVKTKAAPGNNPETPPVSQPDEELPGEWPKQDE